MVLTLAGDKISAITRFDNSVLPRFGLPRTFPNDVANSCSRVCVDSDVDLVLGFTVGRSGSKDPST